MPSSFVRPIFVDRYLVVSLPALLIAVAILFASFEVFFLAVQGALGQSMFGALVSWAVLIGNFLAAAAMLGYFVTRHRTLPRRLVGT